MRALSVSVLLLCVLAPLLSATSVNDIPKWLPAGILQVETGSTFTAGGINYAQKGGPDLGPFQVGRISVERLKRRGVLHDSFSGASMETNMREADRVARLLMVSLYDNEAKRDWFVVAAMWKHGPTGYRTHKAQARERGQRIKNIGERMVREGRAR
jgi:hypothetical protein